MSREKLNQIRNSKWFQGGDLLIYALLFALLLALFLAFVILPEREKLDGVDILVENKCVFSCDFRRDTFEIYDADRVKVEEDGAVLLVTITTERGYNTVSIDRSARQADMTDADCSWSRDCVYMPPIRDTASAPISCIPHGVVVMPVGGDLASDGTLE